MEETPVSQPDVEQGIGECEERATKCWGQEQVGSSRNPVMDICFTLSPPPPFATGPIVPVFLGMTGLPSPSNI